MKHVYRVLQQKEADVAHVRHEIESLKIVSSLLSDELSSKDVRELSQQKEADVARVRDEIESLKIVAPLLSKELASDELTKKRAGSAAEEARGSDDRSEATGTDGLFSSVIANPRPTLWKLLKRKT
jgi:Trp operon repressor